jgi:photosystem II stability/assembly factor-like uncharacterized protein
MNRFLFFIISLFVLEGNLHTQNREPLPTSERNSKENWASSLKSSFVANVKIDNIGPSIFNGRVTDIDVNPSDPSEFFVAYASGGLWHTVNNGTTFVPLFQNESVMTIGDIAVDWKSGTIYLGSGEQNASRSSYAGNGVYKSTDKGKTWTHLGLDETHHISKVIIHPSNPNIVWIAALGHLYSKNSERGIYKSTDGGKTWRHTLMVNDETGASDLVINPSAPDILYAAMWQKSRTAWNFVEAGAGSGIYRSQDGGNTWSNISGTESGFINGEGTGRIGLDISVKNGNEYLFAVVDNNNHRPKKEEKKKGKGINIEDLKVMPKDTFLKLKEEDIASFLKDNGFPTKYTAKSVIELVSKEEIKVADIANYNENANDALFDTPVVGAEVYKSENNGKNWIKTHSGYLDEVYYSYGYYFGQIRVQAGNPEKVYIFGVPIIRSNDGGKTWKNIDGDNVHSDHHSLWLNPSREGHLINGNDGGINISYDDGKNWQKCTHPEVGQFYYITTDNNEPYNVYGGAQDNGVWMGAHTFKNSTRWQSTGEYPYKAIMGGDGMQVQVDNRDNETIYTGLQFGTYFRLNRQKKERTYVTPKHDLGRKPYRWNWQTPILLSPHNQDILYMASNVVLRSMNKGTDFSEISPDLTKGGIKGDVPYGTITTIDESKLKFGLIYTGTDDGLVHVTKDGGFIWTKISDDLPQNLWISRVQSSAFDEGTVYVSLNGYRNDHFKPYVYKSENYGATWQNITSNLPDEPVNVIKEDPLDKNILYVGTDHGLYLSLDKGISYMTFGGELPRVAVHDVVVQSKSKHLLIGTHGRSIYKADISNLYEIRKNAGAKLIVFKPGELRYSTRWGAINNVFSEVLVPKLEFECFSDIDKKANLEIIGADEVIILSLPIDLKKGLSGYSVDLVVDKTKIDAYLKSALKSDWVKKNGQPTLSDDKKMYPVAGKYYLSVTFNKETSKTEFTIK